MITAMFAVYHLVFCNLANIKNPSGIYHGVLERFVVDFKIPDFLKLFASFPKYLVYQTCSIQHSSLISSMHRFWLQPSTALCTLAGIGVGCVLTEIRTKLNAHWLKYLFIAAAVCAVGFQVSELVQLVQLVQLTITVQDMITYQVIIYDW